MSTLDAPPVLHPLEPLSAEEVSAAATILKAEKGLESSARFVFISLHEPPKAAVQAGEAVPREAFVVLYEKAERKTYEAVVSLTEGSVVAFTHIEGVQPPVTFEEFMACEAVVQADPDWQAAMRLRGVEDFTLTMVDPWAAGYMGPEDDPGARRIVRPLTWLRAAPGEHGYARPIEGLVVIVDLDAMKVVEVADHGVVALPPKAGNYDPERMADPDNVPYFEAPRADLKPIEITQPEGASFTVSGHGVAWQKWHVRVGFTPREGLVLHELSYAGRPIIYRASLAEMYVPYGDPAPTHRFKNVFDQGEYGVGWLANPLTLGCDCVGEIQYFDGVVNDQDGEPMVIPNAVCMHEEDYGIGWKHTDFRTEEVEVRRLRRLVISSIATVGNYEYGYFWYLYTDGTIEYEVKLTGVISTGALAPGERPKHGTMVAPGLYGPHHQHFFCVRLDMAVDGNANSVVQVDSEPLPWGPDNPTGTAWVTKRTVLSSEGMAKGKIDPLKGRFWRIENPEKVSALGDPVAYKLVPGENVAPMYAPDSRFAARAGFTQEHVWVTAYDPAERFAAGDYPNQHPGGDGLPRYTEADRPTEGTDVVLWYTFGAHHVVRPEDWPVMPVTHVGFKLKPAGFFAGNPALDMPRSAPKHCHCE
ncbi:primary-amine oxidase [Solirubrobacter ginsenosidimutans]|uniref:Amine oxidase n=1 Tax=Solirubrobacter ginsenosidimutans TaxID=490573 RepID=A0A9X3MQ38_9ACTN|nr:primary-amine oxidase [Solirubrobacter ginsenosidimutans]MDA0159183.1 primary-amine oxidase [Solirubrobacter ginsenosidimutans]